LALLFSNLYFYSRVVAVGAFPEITAKFIVFGGAPPPPAFPAIEGWSIVIFGF
jgi:hypothetical protein